MIRWRKMCVGNNPGKSVQKDSFSGKRLGRAETRHDVVVTPSDERLKFPHHPAAHRERLLLRTKILHRQHFFTFISLLYINFRAKIPEPKLMNVKFFLQKWYLLFLFAPFRLSEITGRFCTDRIENTVARISFSGLHCYVY